VLARAYHLLWERGFRIPLSIVGYGAPSDRVLPQFDPEVRGLVRVNESNRQIEERSMMHQYRSHEILLFPSLYEGFGMVFLEGMASGMAVVASPTGGVPDIIRHDENGYLVPIGDPDALAAAVEELIGHPETRQHLGEAARVTASQLTWERIAERTLDCYRTTAQRSLGRAIS
jgi:glycosyltransferase involved in cell wall biosynthesis